MASLKPIEWLALQRCYFSKPRQGFDLLKAGNIPVKDLPIEQAKRDWEHLEKLKIEMIAWDNDRYPKILREIYDPPLVLLVKGKWEPWDLKPWVAVVGARKATEFGRNKVKELVADLVAKGIGIVSGLAYGIDAEAHKVCLESGGTTWGVLGSGPDILYPARHANLAQKMQLVGGYLSEFPLGTPPYASNFPQRNRIISGLSHAVIIVEANIKSGSRITARFGLEQGREVFVIAPPAEHVAYEGNKLLLEEGATLFESAEQVWEVIQKQMDHGQWTMNHGPREKERKNKNDSSSLLLKLLKKPASIETLIDKLQLPVGKILTELTLLESKGLVKKIPGSLWQSL